jgi:hypothetical protein
MTRNVRVRLLKSVCDAPTRDVGHRPSPARTRRSPTRQGPREKGIPRLVTGMTVLLRTASCGSSATVSCPERSRRPPTAHCSSRIPRGCRRDGWLTCGPPHQSRPCAVTHACGHTPGIAIRLFQAARGHAGERKNVITVLQIPSSSCCAHGELPLQGSRDYHRLICDYICQCQRHDRRDRVEQLQEQRLRVGRCQRHRNAQ